MYFYLFFSSSVGRKTGRRTWTNEAVRTGQLDLTESAQRQNLAGFWFWATAVIDPRGADIGMAQPLLDLDDVRLVLQRARSDGGTERMRAHVVAREPTNSWSLQTAAGAPPSAIRDENQGSWLLEAAARAPLSAIREPIWDS